VREREREREREAKEGERKRVKETKQLQVLNFEIECFVSLRQGGHSNKSFNSIL
jgi:hypothetical protein